MQEEPSQDQTSTVERVDSEATQQTQYAIDQSLSPQAAQGSVSWTASEYILHEKNKGWYGVLLLVTVTLAAIFYVITRDISVVCLVLVGGFVFGFYAKRKPRQIDYEINEKDLVIDSKQYEYREFKSFSIVPEGAFSSIVLWPHKRFAQLTSIYYPPEHEEAISKAIGAHLPFEEHNPDFVERLTRHIRF